MVFGLSKDDKSNDGPVAVKVKDNDQAADAAAELKKMQAKEDSGSCAFC